MRAVTALVPIALMLALGGCDKQSGEAAQQNMGAANNAVTSGEVTSDEVTSDEVPSSGDAASATDGAEGFKHIVDRSHKGEAMPDKSFLDPAGKATTAETDDPVQPLLDEQRASRRVVPVSETPGTDESAHDGG